MHCCVREVKKTGSFFSGIQYHLGLGSF